MPLLIVHVYTYVPTSLTVAVDEPDVPPPLKVTVPGPLVLLHSPVPTEGVFPPKEAEVKVPHMFCVLPTVAVVGSAE